MSKSKVFFCFCLFFIFGIFLDAIIIKIGFFTPHLFISAGFILGIIFISVFWRHKKIVIIGFCLIFLFLGIWRHQTIKFEVKNDVSLREISSREKLSKYDDLEKEITLIGTIIKEPDVRENSLKLTIKPEETKGRILATVNRYPEYNYGDKLEITGKLETPSVFEDFNYKNYLEKEGIYSVIYRPKIKTLERETNRGLSSTFYRKILQFKNKLRKSVYQNLSPPQSSILGAMILGDKSRM